MKNSLLYCAAALVLPACTVYSQNTRNHNLNINLQGDPETCDELRATSNGQLAQANQHFDLTRGEVSTLELNGGTRGVVKVRGWHQAGYTVEACKIAAAEDSGTAQALVRGITVNRSAGAFSYSGPQTDTGSANWQVYFIIHAPDNASLDLQTKNAPISIAGVNGNIKVRATNGPLSISGSTGNIDAQTTNGPISFDGDGGEVHLRAQNGPISLKVGADVWNGSALEASTVNGPMSVSLPAAFQSGVRVETTSDAPFSCRHQACTNASSNLNGDQRVMHLNGSSDIIRVTTENGPLSIGEPKGKAF